MPANAQGSKWLLENMGSLTSDEVNPTADIAIALADGDLGPETLPNYLATGIRPMRIERLRAMGGPYTEEDRARLLYDEHRDVAKVAALMGKPESWVRDVCAWDIAQHQAK